MNVAELEQLVADMEQFHDGASITTDAGTLRTLARRVIAAEKLVEALREIECHDDGTIDLYSPNEIATNALTAYEATK